MQLCVIRRQCDSHHDDKTVLSTKQQIVAHFGRIAAVVQQLVGRAAEDVASDQIVATFTQNTDGLAHLRLSPAIDDGVVGDSATNAVLQLQPAMKWVEDLTVGDAAVAAADERYRRAAFRRTSAESLRRQTAQQHAVAIFKTQAVFRRLRILAAPNERISVDNNAGAARGEHGQIGRVVDGVPRDRDTRRIAQFDRSPLAAEHVAGDVDQVCGVLFLCGGCIGALRSLYFYADDADIRAARLHGRLNGVATDGNFAYDTVGSIEPDLRATRMLSQFRWRLASSPCGRIVILDVVADDLQVVNVASERLDSRDLVPTDMAAVDYGLVQVAAIEEQADLVVVVQVRVGQEKIAIAFN